MIGNHLAWGNSGYTILEEGELDRQTFQLRVAHYLVCMPTGQALEGIFTFDEAKREIERLEAP
ncbi:MAG: hypothetical protein KBT87_03685 [Gammaproteobacteria bacterium]|nr:hypothetical protein [Gammaproteobacteria bacterium]MBQ0773754.1 hypothetical protein [Gammaproteobacteria bacterium]